MGGGGLGKFPPPNRDVGIDGMVTMIGHKLAEPLSNTLVNPAAQREETGCKVEVGASYEG
ncbi:hypothetical protein TanjilG_11127 [Lupinus angustifolius]|uniref:Uncharacterized protein n=1 Tax=Lupinus angustifolius TaxID=3871 RepID=A0A394DAH4_LUPAN|nr:hypothetical protein TanjilG_11127 [Lupinus angustifolius]